MNNAINLYTWHSLTLLTAERVRSGDDDDPTTTTTRRKRRTRWGQWRGITDQQSDVFICGQKRQMATCRTY